MIGANALLLRLTLLGVTRNAYARSLPESTSHGVVGLTPWLDGKNTKT